MSGENEKAWIPVVSISLKIGLALAIAYVAYDYFSRPGGGEPGERRETPLQADLYVYPSRTHITTYDSAGKLEGMQLWTKEGWRWTAEPGGRLLGPLEAVTPSRVYQQDGELRIAFEKDGAPSWLPIGTGGRVYVDEIFFIEDPEELYSHWSKEDWERVRNHETWKGMSEIQAVFSLGFGRPLDVSPGGKTRIVEFPSGPDAEAAVIEFRDGSAAEIR